jgi:hypothetical protein
LTDQRVRTWLGFDDFINRTVSLLDGELYLEHKYPLSENSNEFSVIDDGYCWSSRGNPEIREWQGQQIEVTHWNEGFAPGERVFTTMKTEYRLYLPQNTLFLVHYRAVKQPSTVVRFPVIFSEKPMQSKPSNISVNTAAKKTASTAAKPALLGKNNSPATPLGLSNPPAASLEASEGPILDLLDSWDDFEAAVYRFSLTKSALFKISHNRSTRQDANGRNDMNELEDELATALKTKLGDLQKEMAASTQSFQKSSKQLEEESTEFWSYIARIEQSQDLEDLTKVRCMFLESQYSRDQLDSATDASFIRL